MNPQTTISPQPVAISPQGAASVTPNAAPSVPQLPQAQAPVGTPAPVAAPNLNTSQTLGQIANYYGIPRQTAATAGAGQALGNVAQANFEHQKAENEIDIQNKRDMLDPTKYQFTKNADGSVDILNSVGDKVNIGQYAALTGANPAEALQKAGATDEASQNFITAYNNFQQYAQDQISARNGDAQAQAEVQQYQAANPGLANLDLGQLQTAFMAQYGNYFGAPQTNSAGATNIGNPVALQQVGVNPVIASQNNPQATSAYENPTYANLSGGSATGGSTYTPNSLVGGGISTPGAISSILSQLQNQASQ